jgi:radical SAM superfamily enzyme YgiQ (UPF0313 family)
MKKVRVLLVNLGFRNDKPRLYSLPLGIMSLASYLRQHLLVDVRIINQKLHNLPDDAVVRSAVDFDADVVGLSVLTSSAHRLPYLTSQLRMALPRALIILGGPHISAVGSTSLAGTEADAAVPGEGERTLVSIILHHYDGRDLSGIPGIYRRDRRGDIIENLGTVESIEDLDTLPFPAYDLIDFPAYWGSRLQPVPGNRSRRLLQEQRYISIFTSRGCPYSCFYCHKIFGKNFRMQSADRIIEEIRFCTRTYGADTVKFLDDIFNLDKKRLYRFCERLHGETGPLALHFINGLRTDLLDSNQIDALAESGTEICGFSLETGSQRLQRMIGKNLDIGRYVENVHLAAQAGISTHGFVMLGFPTETEDELETTLKIVRESALKSAGFHYVVPFPGTRLYECALKTHPVEMSRIRYDNLDFEEKPIINLSTVPDDVLVYYKEEADRIFEKPKTSMRRKVRRKLYSLSRKILSHRILSLTNRIYP